MRAVYLVRINALLDAIYPSINTISLLHSSNKG